MRKNMGVEQVEMYKEESVDGGEKRDGQQKSRRKPPLRLLVRGARSQSSSQIKKTLSSAVMSSGSIFSKISHEQEKL